MQNLGRHFVVDSRTGCYYSTAPFAVETLLACQIPLHYSPHSEPPAVAVVAAAVVESWQPQVPLKPLELAQVGFEVVDDAFPFGGGRGWVD